jgi:hypothetical protein
MIEKLWSDTIFRCMAFAWGIDNTFIHSLVWSFVSVNIILFNRRYKHRYFDRRLMDCIKIEF